MFKKHKDLFNDPLTKALASIAEEIMEAKVMCEECGKMHAEGKCAMKNEKLEKDGDDPCWKGYVQVGMKKGKDGKEVPNCVPQEEAFELPEGLQDEDAGDFVVAAAAAKKAGKKKFTFGGKEYPVTIKTDIKTEGFEGCKDCEVVAEELEQPKMNKWLLDWTRKVIEKKLGFKKGSPEYQWSLATLFGDSLTDANFHKEAGKVMKFFRRAKAPENAKELEDMFYDAGSDVANKAGWNGHKIMDAFAYVANLSIGGGLGDKFDALKEEVISEEKVECPKCKGEGCEHCDGKGYHEKMDEAKLAGWIAMFNGKKVEIYKDKDAKDLYTAKQFAIKALKVPKSKQGLLSVEPAYEEFQVEEVVSEAKDKYDIKHKTFSSAIQHAVEIAAKRGFMVDPDDYDQKVAMGPKKPSTGKTNSYSLKLTKGGKEQKKALQVQITNLDNKFFELNMYIQ